MSLGEIARFGIGEAILKPIVNGVYKRDKQFIKQYLKILLHTFIWFIQRADVTFSLRLTHERFLMADPAVVHQIEPFRLVVPWPKEQNRLLAPILPFQPTVSVYI